MKKTKDAVEQTLAGSKLLEKLVQDVRAEDGEHEPEWMLWSKGVLGELLS